jgi:FAD/FMN-containing dehydrogenase
MHTTTSNGREGAVPEGIAREDIHQLATQIRGRVLLPDDRGYHASRRVFNAMIDRYPALIIRCADEQDVLEGVKFAGDRDLSLAIKGGGHSVAGTAACEGGLMLDLSPMKAVMVDPPRTVATVGPGLTLGEFDRETQRYGLATPTGVVSMTGLSGLALGGGLGWLNGLHGLTCDNLLAADVVTASGEHVSASEDEHPDLFWGLRGGGGNFGVVTSFTLRLHSVHGVFAGALTFPAAKAKAALRRYSELVCSCPERLTANASLFRALDGAVAVSVAICHAGKLDEADQLLAPLRKLGPASDAISPVSYLSLQQAADAAFPPGQQHYWKSGYLTAIDDELIDLMVELVAEMPSLASGVGFQRLHGAAARVDAAATAYPHRSERWDCLILSQWSDRADTEANVAWTRTLFDAIRPWFDGVYVNNLGVREELSVKDAYGANYGRLAELKERYDPRNLFRQNHNIAPIA